MKSFPAFLITLLMIVWIFAPVEYLIKFTSDDSYFYLKTALNFSKGAGSTFDGINPTNGYHPLWFLISSLTFKICNLLGMSSEIGLLRAIFIVSSLLNLFSIYLLSELLMMISPKSSNLRFYSLTLLSIPLIFFYLIGLEIQAVILTLIMALYFFLKWFDKYSRDKKTGFLLSLSLSLFFLARIDLFWYLLIGILIFTFLNERELIPSLLKILFLPLILFSIYIITNKLFFGLYFPISSYYKISPDIIKNLKFFPTPSKNPIDFSILILILVLTFVAILQNRSKFRLMHFQFLLIVHFAFLIFLMINFLFNVNGPREWYYIYPFNHCYNSIVYFFSG